MFLWTGGRTFETHFVRSTWRSPPKNKTIWHWVLGTCNSSLCEWLDVRHQPYNNNNNTAYTTPPLRHIKKSITSLPSSSRYIGLNFSHRLIPGLSINTTYPKSFPKFIHFFLVHSLHIPQISQKSTHNFLSYPTNKQINKTSKNNNPPHINYLCKFTLQYYRRILTAIITTVPVVFLNSQLRCHTLVWKQRDRNTCLRCKLCRLRPDWSSVRTCCIHTVVHSASNPTTRRCETYKHSQMSYT